MRSFFGSSTLAAKDGLSSSGSGFAPAWGSSESIEQVADAVGFGGAERMRRAFVRVFGQPHQALRRLARGTVV